MKGSFLIRSLVPVAVFMNPIIHLTTKLCMDSESLLNRYMITCSKAVHQDLRCVLFRSEQGNEPGRQKTDHVRVTFIAVLFYFTLSPPVRLLHKIELRAHELPKEGSRAFIFNLAQSLSIIVIVTVAAISYRDGWH